MKKRIVEAYDKNADFTGQFIDLMVHAMRNVGMDNLIEPVNTFKIIDASDVVPDVEMVDEPEPPDDLNEVDLQSVSKFNAFLEEASREELASQRASQRDREIEDIQTVGQLTKGNTKLGGVHAFSQMPRATCPTGCKLSKVHGSSCEGCFGADGQYAMNDFVKGKLANNMINAEIAIKTEIGQNLWIAAMIRLITNYGKDAGDYFRVHDVGDFFDERYFLMWLAVANELPNWTFWVPTKEFALPQKHKDKIPPNFVIRLSTPMIDEPPIGTRGFPTATVHHFEQPYGFPCPAPDQGGQCQSCRACWDPKVKNVSYRLHGQKVIARYERGVGEKEGIPGGRKTKAMVPLLPPGEQERRRAMATESRRLREAGDRDLRRKR